VGGFAGVNSDNDNGNNNDNRCLTTEGTEDTEKDFGLEEVES
jgi:hypothetical protein